MELIHIHTPFTYIGIDCFGPFYVKDGQKELKKYGLLFTYMHSQSVHIEVLDDLSSDAFLNALHCFISIRGNVSQLHSDQGTIFVGAKNKFIQLMKGLELERMKDLGCNFVMNLPASSHMGGVWERQIWKCEEHFQINFESVCQENRQFFIKNIYVWSNGNCE